MPDWSYHFVPNYATNVNHSPAPPSTQRSISDSTDWELEGRPLEGKLT